MAETWNGRDRSLRQEIMGTSAAIDRLACVGREGLPDTADDTPDTVGEEASAADPQPQNKGNCRGVNSKTGGAGKIARKNGKVNKPEGKQVRIRTVMTERQINTLKSSYEMNDRPDALQKERLIDVTGLTHRVIRVWFQNKRCKEKKRRIKMQEDMQKSMMSFYSSMRGVPMVAQAPSSLEAPLPINVDVLTSSWAQHGAQHGGGYGAQEGLGHFDPHSPQRVMGTLTGFHTSDNPAFPQSHSPYSPHTDPRGAVQQPPPRSSSSNGRHSLTPGSPMAVSPTCGSPSTSTQSSYSPFNMSQSPHFTPYQSDAPQRGFSEPLSARSFIDQLQHQFYQQPQQLGFSGQSPQQLPHHLYQPQIGPMRGAEQGATPPLLPDMNLVRHPYYNINAGNHVASTGTQNFTTGEC
ncbi:homeobox protein vab-7 [Hyalella azteca]|uniref:Homeobox protein vab-7 n=1 Tax=Hyalella azteca TaxID=294128 RepID=A0A979FQ66_HYAAZ|nr:homeobox protein vab-7 [Hyalella azteca]